MPITRMDMMTMAPKTQEATPIKVAQHEKPINDQIMNEMQMNKQIMHDSMRTVHSSEAENADHRYDAKEKGNNKYKQQKKNKKNSKDKKEKDQNKDDRRDYVRPCHIDIII